MKPYNLLKDGISQSLMSKYMTCPRSFEIAVAGWSSPEKAVMVLGSQGHAFIEAHHKGKNGAFDFDAKVTSREDQELIKGIVTALIPAYIKQWKSFDAKYKIKPEIVFDVPFNGVRLRGKIDAVYTSKGEVWLKETKFKGRISEDELDRRLSIDWQACFYAYAYFLMHGTWPKGFIYDVVRYPSMKGNAKDLYDDIVKGTKKEPDHWFKRWCVELHRPDMMGFGIELAAKLDEIRNRKLFYRNQCACASGWGMCKYIDVCTKNSYEGLVQRELFNELK